MNKNLEFYNRLMSMIKNSGKSVNQIERELGYPRNSLHNYKSGSEPSCIRLLELSSYFEVPPEYLIGKTVQEEVSLTSPSGIFEKLSEKQKIEMLKLCQEWVFSRVVDTNLWY